jgi:hypothetical protein
MALRLRRGTNAERLTITPEVGELVYTTDTKLVYVGDGATQGGISVAGGVGGSFLTELLQDTSPQLGGDLDLNNSNIIGAGNININGTITATGNINLGDGTEDTISVGGLISSSLIPSGANLDLGSLAQQWDTAYTTTVNTTTLEVDDIVNSNSDTIYSTVTGELTVDDISFTGSITDTSNSSIVYDSSTQTLTSDILKIGTILRPDSSLFYEASTESLHTTTILLNQIYGDDSTIVFDNDSKTIFLNTVLANNFARTDGFVVYRGVTNTLAADEVEAITFTGDLTGSVFSDDSSPFFDANTGSITVTSISSNSSTVNIGTEQQPDDRLQVFYDGPGPVITGRVITGNNNFLEVRSSRGTIDSPTAVQPGDGMSGLILQGYDGNDYNRTSAIAGFADSNGVATPGAISGRLLFVNKNLAGDGDVIATFDAAGTFNAPVIQPSTYADAAARDGFIASPVAGQIVHVTDNGQGASELQAYDGNTWTGMSDNLEVVDSVPSGSTYTLLLDDNYTYYRLSDSSAVSVAVPPESSVDFPIGSNMTFVQSGTGQLTFVAGAGVTINSPDGLLSTRVQYSAVSITKVASDAWDLIGDLV